MSTCLALPYRRRSIACLIGSSPQSNPFIEKVDDPILACGTSKIRTGNLRFVVKAPKYPDKPMIIACDYNHHLDLALGINPGHLTRKSAI